MVVSVFENVAARPGASGPARRLLGVDIGGTAIKWSIVCDGVAETGGSVPTPRIDEHAVLRAVAGLTDKVRDQVEGIGIAVPGTVDPVRRSSVFVPNLPGDWTHLAVADEMEALSGLPVALLNDARAFAWAEHGSGAAKGVANAAFFTLGTGVGGAIAFNGQILVGALDSIGEMGHVPVNPHHGELCICGGRGCLETIASASAVVGRLARTYAMSQSAVLRRLTEDGTVPLTAKLVAQGAREGDVWCQDAFDRAADALGLAASTIGLLLQLDVVVIGGGLAPAADLYLPRVQAALDARTSLTGRIEVRSAHYGGEAGSIGAAIFAAARLSPA